ncbi:MAG: radical SAM protein [Candidatus Scalindua sp.]
MKVLLVYPNISASMTPQIGLLSLGSYLIKSGIEIKICDLTFSPLWKYANTLHLEIENWKPDVIAISCRTMGYPVSLELCKMVKSKHPNRLLIAGGPHMTFRPEDLVGIVDYGVIGEGEGPLLDLTTALANGRRRDIQEIPNIIFQRNGEVIQNPLRPLLDLSTLPMPMWSLFDERHYLQHFLLNDKPDAKICGSFEGSRGCPFTCSYCSNETLKSMYRGKGKWRREKPASTIRKEILEFKSQYGLDLIYFVDEVVMTTDKRTSEIRENLHDLKVPFVFMERPEFINEKRVIDMRQAGAYSCSIGVESGNETLRKERLRRSMSDEEIYESFHLMKDHGIQTHTFTMFGMPGETKEMMKMTYELLKNIQPDSAQATTFYPLPGTSLEKYCKKHNYFTERTFATSYYSKSYLKFDADIKLSIERYCNLINIGTWRSTLKMKIIEYLGLRSILFIRLMFNIKIVYDSILLRGFAGTIRKVINKIKFQSITLSNEKTI